MAAAEGGGEAKEVKRTRSMITLPSVAYDRFGDFYYKQNDSTAHSYGVRRTTSVPDLYGPPAYKLRGTPRRLYYGDTGSRSDYLWDLKHYSRPLYYPYSAWPNRRYYGLDPPWNLWWNYPSLGYVARYSRYSEFDNHDPVFWRRFRDPYYERPLWYPYRPWYYESMANQRAADMCRRGVISFDIYSRYWLTPYYFDRRHYYDFGPYVPPSWFRSPRRYYFYYNVL